METINDLDQITAGAGEHYRVSVFGSSRIQRGDPIYEQAKKLCFELARLGADIVTGGGPGLMEGATPGPEGRPRVIRARSGWPSTCRPRPMPIPS